MGRKIKGETPLSRLISIRLPEELIRALRAAAVIKGVTVSDLMRDVIKEGLSKRGH